MSNIRLIARLDVKAPNLIKGINLEGVRVIGDPKIFATNYYHEEIDEIIYIDAVASLYERSSLYYLVSSTSQEVFIPMTVGGGLRSIENVDQMLRSGADKVALNTAVIKNPKLITEISECFGAQCMTLSIEAKQTSKNTWEAYTDNGREKTGINVLDWVEQAVELGIGEVLLTSVDKEGMCEGFDVSLVKSVTSKINVPVIASGGMGSLDHLKAVIEEGGADAVAIAHMLHYKKTTITEIKNYLAKL